MRALRFPIVAVAFAASASCGSGGGSSGAYCNIDDDCDPGEVCAHSHECLSPDQVHSVVIRWTVNGAPASAASCAGIAHLDVGYRSTGPNGPEAGITFSPVLCPPGAFPNDKWPIRYDTATISAVSATGSHYYETAIPSTPTADVTIDIQPP